MSDSDRDHHRNGRPGAAVDLSRFLIDDPPNPGFSRDRPGDWETITHPLADLGYLDCQFAKPVLASAGFGNPQPGLLATQRLDSACSVGLGNHTI